MVNFVTFLTILYVVYKASIYNFSLRDGVNNRGLGEAYAMVAG
jgi:hypothetical protein